MSGANLYYWDTCLFLAWLKNEQPPARTLDEVEGLQHFERMVSERKIRLMTSAITYVELTEINMPAGAFDQFTDMMRRSNVTVVAADVKIAKLAKSLRDYYFAEKEKNNGKSLCVPDAIHLATAIMYKAEEFHTFDRHNTSKSLGLIPLSGNVAGYSLKICRPENIQRELDV